MSAATSWPPPRQPATPSRNQTQGGNFMAEHRFLYADNAATTSLSPTALRAMEPFLTVQYGNPSSLYRLGQEARRAVEQARRDLAACLHAEPEEILFTSGGTESDNWALRAA